MESWAVTAFGGGSSPLKPNKKNCPKQHLLDGAATSLRGAICANNVAQVKQICCIDKDLLERADEPPNFLPFAFCMLKYTKVVAVDYFTPLQLASIHDNTCRGDMVKTLLDANCDVDARGYLEVSPLNLASRNGQAGAIEALLNGGADRSGGDLFGREATSVAKDDETECLLLGEPDYVQIASPSRFLSGDIILEDEQNQALCKDLSSILKEAESSSIPPTYRNVKMELIKLHGVSVFNRNKLTIQAHLKLEEDGGSSATSRDKPVIIDHTPRFTWKHFSGRESGSEGYMLGDLVHGLASRAKNLMRGGKMSFKADYPRSHLSTSADVAGSPITTFDFVPEDEVQRLEKIGEGASSNVYKSSWRGTLIAEKMLEIDDEEANRTRMMTEIEMLTAVKHDNIVRLIGAYCSDSMLCIYSEFAENGNLFNFIHSQTDGYDDETLKGWSLEVSSALKFLHQFPSGAIVHRDIKSPNVLMFTRDDQLITKICDFGIAHLADITSANLDDCPDSGTIRWMSPEAMTHEATEFSCKTDVFSFGMLLFELCTKQLPFAELQWQQIMMAVALHDRRPQLPEFVPPDFQSIIKMCWAREPAERPDMETVFDLLVSATFTIPPIIII